MKVLGVQDLFQSLLQALRLNFSSKMRRLDAYLPSYVTFRRFWRVWEVAKPFFLDFDCPGTTERRIKEAVIKSAADAASPQRFQAAIQSAASAASLEGIWKP